MAIEMKDLPEEQRDILKKHYRAYLKSCILASFLYGIFLFFANVSIVLIDALYLHNTQARFLLAIGTGVIVFGGLRGTIEEKRAIMKAKVKEVIGI